MATCFHTVYLMIMIFGVCCIGRNDRKSSNTEEKDSKWNGCTRSKYKLKCNGLQRDIPEGVTSVHLNNLYIPDRVLKRGTFSSKNWEYVTKLTITADSVGTSNNDIVNIFDSMCFYGLKNLEILRISISSSIEFRHGTLVGIPYLKLLDLSGCHRFYIDHLISALNNTKAVPNLRSLNLSLFNTYHAGIRLTNDFFRLISMKRIKELDISSIQVLFMNLTSLKENCDSLEYLNISRLMLNDYVLDRRLSFCKNLKKVDASYITLPSTVIPDRGPQRHVYENKSIPIFFNLLPFCRNIEYFNMAGFMGKQSTYILKNMTFYIVGMSKFNLKTLVLRDNIFERLDVKVDSKSSKLESIDLSQCEIRFLNPLMLSSFSLLKTVDLSKNRLSDMVLENSGLFERLFQNLSRLRHINLSSNKLKDIPYKLFLFNRNLESVDLSNNLIFQISFGVKGLKKLQMLNLEHNQITILDSASITSLNMIEDQSGFNKNVSNVGYLLKLMNNPISCSNCESLASITWIFHSRVSIENSSLITCRDNDGKQVEVDQSTVRNVQTVCNRPKIIIISCTTVASVIIVALVLFFVIRTRRRRKAQELEMADRVALIREGAETHQFVVFLSYSSKDEEFVEKYVYNSLNENLQHIIGDDRDLVCEGDRDFQLGRPIHDQISVLLKKSSVVLVVLSDSYSQSIHCRNEFDQAFMLEKPIVLMIKDEVDTRLMTPLIRDLYEKRTRVLWMWEDGQYKLKTTWENLCLSIVALIDCR